jgi:predicted metal-dependent hydrolase
MATNTKSTRIQAIVDGLRGGPIDPHYLGYFRCFNQQLYYEAHEVLEQLWLPKRAAPDGAFYKGLIQLAGAFVHIQKNRPGPAAALFRLSCENLSRYPDVHHSLELPKVLELIQTWLVRVESAPVPTDLLFQGAQPKLFLLGVE